MMKRISTILSILLVSVCLPISAYADEHTDAASALAGRILPKQSKNIDFVTVPSQQDAYSLEFYPT